MLKKAAQHGFTLVEMIIVIVITGIVAAVVAVFIRGPIDAYIATGRRAELTDAADTAIRRIMRDVRLAVPRSVRVTVAAGVSYLEFVPSDTGGRYVWNGACFNAGCTSLLMHDVGDVGVINNGDWLVINNQSSNSNGTTDACSNQLPSVYCSAQNRAAITGVSGMTLSFANTIFRPASGSASLRFQIAQGPVTYRCDPGSGQLTRHAGYAFSDTQPTTGLPAGALLASQISACSFDYTALVFERWGLLGIRLGMTDAASGESISLYQEVHIDNLP